MMNKYLPLILTAGLALAAAGTTSAQTVTAVFIGKGTSYVQTDASTVIVNPQVVSSTYGGAYSFGVNVEGTGLSAPTVTLAAGSSPPSGHNGGVLGYNTDDGAWQYGSPNFNNWGATTASEIDTLFANGDYTVSIPSLSPVTVNLSTPGVALNTPQFSLTGGTWSNGVYVVNVNSSVTITSNQFAAFGSNADGHIGYYLWNNGDGNELAGNEWFKTGAFSFPTSPDDFISYTINPGALVSGQTYSFEGGFAAVIDTDTTTISGALVGTFWEYSTQFQIQAVPEPSTYAAIAGALCLGVVMLRRRMLG